MALINCPSCKQRISDKSEKCPECGFSFNLNKEEMERLKVIKYRDYRDKMYRFKMLTFFAVAIALVGVVPMVWDYARAIDYGFNAVIINRWGVHFAVAGFLFSVLIRIFMVIVKRNYKQSN